jgi:hypothetical protein
MHYKTMKQIIFSFFLLFLSCSYWDNRNFILTNFEGEAIAIYQGEKANQFNQTLDKYILELRSDSTYVLNYAIGQFGSDVLINRSLKTGNWCMQKSNLILRNGTTHFESYPNIPYSAPLSTAFTRTISNQIEYKIIDEGLGAIPLSSTLLPLKLTNYSKDIRNIILERIHKTKNGKRTGNFS